MRLKSGLVSCAALFSLSACGHYDLYKKLELPKSESTLVGGGQDNPVPESPRVLSEDEKALIADVEALLKELGQDAELEEKQPEPPSLKPDLSQHPVYSHSPSLLP